VKIINGIKMYLCVYIKQNNQRKYIVAILFELSDETASVAYFILNNNNYYCFRMRRNRISKIL